MNDAPVALQPRALTTLNNRPRSGSWSNYQYYQQQQRQHKQALFQETKLSKPNFLTKLIQKRPTSTNAVCNNDDESSLVVLQTPPLVDSQQQHQQQQNPATSKHSNGQDQLAKRKKEKSLGRFLKKLGKNATTFITSADDYRYQNTVDNLTLLSQMQEQPVHGLDIQVTDPVPENSTAHQNPIITTPVTTSAQSLTQLCQFDQQPKSTQDDIHLQYYRTNDLAPCAPVMPRSTSFDTAQSHIQVASSASRFFAPNSKSHYSKLATYTSPRDTRILLAGIYTSSLDETLKNTTDTTLNRQHDDVDGNDSNDGDDFLGDSDVDDPRTINGDDHLSKRLSGGHFGSAGGLIINTLSLSELSTVSNNRSFHQKHHDIEINDNDQAFEPVSTPTPALVDPDRSKQSLQLEMERQADKSLTRIDNKEPEEETHSVDSLISQLSGHVDEEDCSGLQDVACSQPSSYTSPRASSVDESSTMEATAEDYARRIWEQDDTVYSSLEHVAEWIGNGSPASHLILKAYMSYFDFQHVRLEDAFRQLCAKLSMKAESQQIDRILEEFSKRYWDCNQQSIFGNADIIHAVVYSLVLLNTDLHVVQGERKKMSRLAFIRNTMDAIRSQLNHSQESNNHVLDNGNSSNISAVSWDDDKLTSTVSVQSQILQHEWTDLKRTPSCQSSCSRTSSYSGKMSSSFDVSNTTSMSSAAFGSIKWQKELESVLKQLYDSVRHKQIMQPESKTGAIYRNHGSTRNNSNGYRYKAFKRNVGTMMWKAARDSIFLNDSKAMVIDLPQPTTPRSTISNRSGNHPRRKSISSMRSGVSQHSQSTRSNITNTVNYQAVASLLHHSDLPTSYTSAAPYYKEGMLVRKHLMEQANEKARQRDWKECFMVVDRGEIRMYRLDEYGQRRKTTVVPSRHPLHGMMNRGASLASVSESSYSHEQSSTCSDLALGGGDWLAHAQVIGEIDLKHTLSNALPSGYSRRRRHAFALQQANGGVYLFHVGSAEQVMEWVTTCNYWAARESKEPLMGGVGNLEYGWGSCLDGITDDDNDDDDDQQGICSETPITVSPWQPPIPPLMASSLNEMAQLDTLLKHVKTLNDELDQHRDLKRKIERRFTQETSNRTFAMTNFQNKTQYLLHEIIKYQNYCDSIETSLALQDKAIHQDNLGQEAGSAVVS